MLCFYHFTILICFSQFVAYTQYSSKRLYISVIMIDRHTLDYKLLFYYVAMESWVHHCHVLPIMAVIRL